MALAKTHTTAVTTVAENAARELLSVRHWGDASFITLPMVYPGGAFVTVKIEIGQSGFRVGDNGFAYRELESMGINRSFGNTARSVAENQSLEVDRRSVFVDVPPELVSRAICDVAAASWQIADTAIGRVSEEEEADLEERLRDRLSTVFGSSKVANEHTIQGASTSAWDVSAIVRTDGNVAVFHAVSKYPNSVFKASTAFHDLALLEKPPALIAVVRKKADLGPRLNLLAQIGNVIEQDQPDRTYERLVA